MKTVSHPAHHRPAHARLVGLWSCVWGGVLMSGCHAPQRVRPPLDPISLGASIQLINANTARITAALRASGPVDGEVVNADGRRVSFHVDGVLFFLEPSFLRFDLKKLGERQLLLGSNASGYWMYTKEDGKYVCGQHDDPNDLPPDLAIRPDQIADALALTPLDTAESSIEIVQRIVDDYQQLLFLTNTESERIVIQKEYWIDRRAPRVVRRVVFRDTRGAAEMVSTLDDYRVQPESSLYLPHTIGVSWPSEKMSIRFSVTRWRLEPRVTQNGPQFATPRECLP